MKKFHDWFNDKLNENNPQHSASSYGRHLAQIMGWPNGERIRSTFGKIGQAIKKNTVGLFSSKQDDGIDIYQILADENKIEDVIKLAVKDGVFKKSTYLSCHMSLEKLHSKFRTSGTEFDTNKYRSYLLYNILGKLNRNSELDYFSAEELYHDVIGTHPGQKKTLHNAYKQDETNLKVWKETASVDKPHPTFDVKNTHSIYYGIETSGIVSPYNLLEKLIADAPHGTISFPSNKNDIHDKSVEFAEAYFPERVNLARKIHGGNEEEQSNQNQQQNVQGNTVADFNRMLDNFASGFSDIPNDTPKPIPTGGRRSEIMRKLQALLGKAPEIAQGSPMSKLDDHTTFYGLKNIIESKKHN